MNSASSGERALAERRMREVNEAWRVLGNPQRRREYDQELRGTAATFGGTAGDGVRSPSRAPDTVPDDDLVDVAPQVGPVGAMAYRHLPWILLVVVLGGIFIATAYASSSRTGSGVQPSAPTPVGSCIDVSPGPSTTSVPCDGPHEFEIVGTSASPDGCPDPSEPRRFSAVGEFLCVTPGRGGR